MGQFSPSVVRRVHLTGTHGHQAHDGKLLLGEITDSVVGALEMYSESSVELVNSRNRKRGLGESNCQVSGAVHGGVAVDNRAGDGNSLRIGR